MGMGAIGVSSFPSSSHLVRNLKATTTTPPPSFSLVDVNLTRRISVCCYAAQESSISISTVAVDRAKDGKEAISDKEAEAPVKPKPAAKAEVKPLPELMQEEVIPSLQKILEAQDDLSEIELSFRDNKLEGSFLKNGDPHSFWAFFPDGVLTGPKGFSLSSYGNEASTVEPFLIDEKKITSKHIVFWVEKRLAAQGLIPVWK